MHLIILFQVFACTSIISGAQSKRLSRSFYSRDPCISRASAKTSGYLFFRDNHDEGNILRLFEYAHRRYDCDVFLVDNIMTAALKDAATLGYWQAQSVFTGRLVAFAKGRGVHVHLVAHPRKTDKRIEADDVGGSADITNRADNVFKVERVKDEMAELCKMDGDMLKHDACIEMADALDGALRAAQPHGKAMAKIVLPSSLPGLNEYITALDKNRYTGAALKKEAQSRVEWCAKVQLRRFRPAGQVYMRYTWFERNRRRDKDNISSFGRKVIQDGLVKAGILRNDGWAQIEGFSDEFRVDPKRPRVEVEIEEVLQ